METILETIQRSSSISFPGLFGDWTIDPPACFTLFGRCVYFYGVFIALGFLLGITYCARSAKRFGLREDDVYDLVLWLIPLSIIGARLRGFEDFGSVCLSCFEAVRGGYCAFDAPAVLASVTAEECRAFLTRVLSRERTALSVVRPGKE